jgi:phage-related tail protein
MQWAMWSAFGALASAGGAWITLVLMRSRESRAQVQADEATKNAAKTAKERADQAHAAAGVATARCELIAHELAGFKVEVAERYVTTRAVDQLAERLTIDMHRLSDELRASTSELGRRFDELTRTFIEAGAARAAGRRKPT